MSSRMRRLILLSGLAMACLALASPGWAQTRSEIRGTIKDSSGAVLPGVTVVLTSPNMVGGARTVVTDDKGVYRFSDLPLGVYEVDATLQGFQTMHRTGLQVQFGTAVTVDLVMPVGNVTETVTVTGATPVVDVTSSASTTKIEDSFLQNLPAAGRSARPNEIMSLAPGVTTNRTAHGGMRDANNIMVDGMSSSFQGGGNIRTSVLNYNWMQELQVVALGANAEYGEFTGTVSNMIMRSGSNNFSGLVDYFTTRQGWLGKNTGDLSPTLQAKFKPAEIVTNYDTTYQAGGPIKKDKLFFFAGGEYYRNSGVVAGAQPGPDGKPIPNSERWARYIGKVNWAVSNAVKLEGFVEHDNDAINPYGTLAALAADAMYSGSIPKTMYNGRFTWTINDKTLFEARGGGFKLGSDFTPYPASKSTGPYSHQDTVTGITTQNYSGISTSDQSRVNVSGSLTKWVDGFVGKSHELKFGVEYERTELLNWVGFPGGRVYSDNNGKPNQVRMTEGTTTDGVSARVSVYAQDSWALTDRLTLQPGVRFSMD
ncbi:MAG: TonB-dependent receptor, partial [Planctomycetes bacterium]|nr:TonB-dependent receptor [Planctomycetota bacterium]